MNPEPAAPAATPIASTREQLVRLAREWKAGEGERWIFVLKSMLAAFSALWLAFRLGLDSPSTAMTTTFILALPSSGMVLEKAFYRLLGTVVGCASALLLIALFPQQTPMLFIGLALWVGLCTGGAAMYRNQQSYSFVLAGYTACMIAIPAIDAPAGAFLLAVTRLTEVSLGVICATVVNDALFPRHHNAQLMRTVQARRHSFVGFCREVLERRLSPAEAELTHLRFAADIAALESGRAAAFFEAAHARSQTRQLHAFNAALMTALTTLYTLHRLLHRLHLQPGSPAPQLLQAMQQRLAQALADDVPPDLPALEQDIAAARAELSRRLEEAADAGALPPPGRGASGSGAAQGKDANEASLAAAGGQPDGSGDAAAAQELASLTPQWQIDFDTAVELLERFAANLAAFHASYDGLTQQKRSQVSEPRAYKPKTPPGIVLASGFRAAAALLGGAVLWYWMAWPHASTALLMTTIFCALCSSSPRPTAMVKQILTGFLIAWPLSFLVEFFLVARASGFPMLVLAALPLFAYGSYLSTNPKKAGVGIGIILFSAQVIAPANQMHYDIASFLNITLAQNGGVLLSFIIFMVLLPEHTMGNRAHVAAALWREALALCTASTRGLRLHLRAAGGALLPRLLLCFGPGQEWTARLRHRFDNRVRDLLNQLNAASGPAPGAPARLVVRQGLTLLELGHSIIELRALIATSAQGPVATALQQAVDALANYFRQPERGRCELAITSLLHAGATVRTALPEASAARAARLQTALTDLHSIYTSLLDQMPQIQGEVHHAA
ncbi:FUSC family protein [Massilia sp. NR 4-1]|uniref:FUSC family protein n=1 Tax=Massilia sp. NR 4-1 TaxID=1678028 RepID=UPI00067C4C96|nr:FUSC family protein [Massilia sp. NR 4-1]AKU22068.1 fusaric acid resistance protein [Massilia sp. NR 4-1]